MFIKGKERIMVSRNKNSLFNALAALGTTLVNGLLGIVVTKFVIAWFGSDFNGLNSTANQIVNILLVLEGGFTVASNVALFGPLTRQETDVVNGVLAATRQKFRKVGFLFLAIGIAIAAVYGFAAQSQLPWEFIFTLIVMTVVPAAFNLYYATTYRVLLQTQQKEYIISLFTILTVGLGHLANIGMILLGGPMRMVRVNTMAFTLLNSLLIGWYAKRKNPFLNLKTPPRPELIQGTRDVMAQKITGVIYQAAPMVFLTVSPTGGTMLASVYYVYNQVLLMLKTLLHSVIDAPRHSLGQLMTEREKKDVWPVFAQYEYIAFLAVFVILTTCGSLIMPFIGLYTSDFADANYYDSVIAFMMVIIAVIEMIHIPSGHLLNMAGLFRVCRNIQVSSCLLLIVTMAVGGVLWGVYGMLIAILLCAVLLAVLEMGYVHTKFFPGKLPALLYRLLPLAIFGAALCWLEIYLLPPVNSYFSFLLWGIILGAGNVLGAVAVGFCCNHKEFCALTKRAVSLLKRR